MPRRAPSTLILVVLVAVLTGCDSQSATNPSPVCTPSLTPATVEIAADGGPGTAQLTVTGATCAWTLTVSAPWIALLDSASGTGSTLIHYDVGASPDTASRSGTLSVGDASQTVHQAGRSTPPCTYALTPSTAAFDDDGGTGTAMVTAPDGCAWSATANVPWVTFTQGAQGTGDGTITYSVARNETTTPRQAVVMVADQTLTIVEDGESPPACEYAVGPVQFDPCMPAGEVSTTITTSQTCPWTVSSNATWLTSNVASGTGSATVGLSFTANYDAPREAIAMLRWPTVTAGQNVRVSQAGCIYATSRQTFDFAATGGSGTFDVLQQSVPTVCGGPLQNGCLWTATSDVAWITVTTLMPKVGDDRVSFTVAPNGDGASRTGRIRVRDKVVLVTQAAMPHLDRPR